MSTSLHHQHHLFSFSLNRCVLDRRLSQSPTSKLVLPSTKSNTSRISCSHHTHSQVRCLLLHLLQHQHPCVLALTPARARFVCVCVCDVLSFLSLQVGRRPYTSVMIVPTGVGASIGGFAGDALPVARTLASVVDCLISHPNVTNHYIIIIIKRKKKKKREEHFTLFLLYSMANKDALCF